MMAHEDILSRFKSTQAGLPRCQPSTECCGFEECTMGLTVYYDWKVKVGAAKARRLIAGFHALARALPFDHVSDIHEQNPPDGKSMFRFCDESFGHGALYLSRRRADGSNEVVQVAALHVLFFSVRVEGAESALVGLASHPPVVLHREDLIKRNPDGSERERILGRGDAIEFPTRRRGYYSWQSFCKTQYAGNPRLGGEANFLKAHLSLIELLDQIRRKGISVRVRDDSRYATHRNANRLLRSLRDWDAVVANVVGQIGDALDENAGAVVAPIKDRPDFEHLEAKGVDVLRKLAARQRKRKKH
jgi:hypothetical protein